uniref:Putative 8.9 kDa family member n=1 Tax=Rhipicephalus pulchellus TaxID=72859 RepID=L7LPY2_RHIPC
MTFHIMSMKTMSVVLLLLTHLLSSGSDAYSTEVAEVTEATEATESTESTEIFEFTDKIPKILRLNCTYNGTEYEYGYTNGTNPECKFYWCNNGTMEIAECKGSPPSRNSGYGNCKNERRSGIWPYCCSFERAC